MSENPVHSRLRRLVDRPSRAQESLDPGNVVVRWFFPTQCLRVGADWQLTGVGCSAMIVVDITYISEMFPAKQRGTYQGRTMSIGLLGIPATAYVARFCIPMASWGWRLVFVWGSLGI